MNEPQQTILNKTNSSTRADFTKSDFDQLVIEKGRLVMLEKALRCPCKSASVGNLTSCRNCGGSGWIFVNPRETRIILQGIEVVTKLEGWSEENRGMARITALAEEKIAFMDRITILDEGESTFTEVLSFKKKESVIFAYTSYPIENVEYAGLFVSINDELALLEPEVDYTIVDQIFKLDPTKYGEEEVDGLSVSLRYTHKPSFLLVETKRDTMQSYKLMSNGVEVSQVLPLSGYARRTHYVIDTPNLTGDKLLNNNYTEE